MYTPNGWGERGSPTRMLNLPLKVDLKMVGNAQTERTFGG